MALMKEIIRMICPSHCIKGWLALGMVLALMATTVMSVETRWGYNDALLATALPVLALLGMACLLSQKGEKAGWSWLDKAVGLWYAYYFFRVWMGGEYPCATQFLKDSCWFFAYVCLRGIFSRTKVSPRGMLLIILVYGSYEAFIGIKQVLAGESRHYLYFLTGSFLNPGPYSAYLMVAFIAALTARKDMLSWIATLHFSGHRYLAWTYDAMLMLIVIVLPATWSRAAMLVVGVMCLWYYREDYRRWRYGVWGMFVLVFIALYFLKAGSAHGRLLTWLASLTSWSHAPWLGVGVGGFRHACAEGIVEMYASSPSCGLFTDGNIAEYAFCDLLKVLTEQGIIGALACLLTVTLLLSQSFHYYKPLFFALLSLFLFSLFSYPFEQYPFRFFTVMVAVSSSSQLSSIHPRGKRRLVAVVLTGLAFAGSSLFVAREVGTRRASDQETGLFMGSSPLFIKDQYKFLPKESDHPQFLFTFAKALRQAGRYNDSNAILRQGTLISNDPMFYLLQGNNYKDMKQYPLAERAYRKAYAMMPNRIYPLYQLMLLYQVSGQRGKMRQMARKILEFRPKVPSPATREIKSKAKEVL